MQPTAAPSADPTPVRIRLAIASDLPLVLSTWRRSSRLSQRSRRVPAFAHHAAFDKDVRDGVLREPDTRIIVACDAAHPDAIHGWLCYTPGVPTVHYAYTAKAWRGRHLFAALLHAAGVRDDGQLLYTARPQEWRRVPARRALGVEQRLLATAARRSIQTRFVDLAEWLGRTHAKR